jgi:hypothetical protein
MELPRRGVLLSEDGKRGFSPWGSGPSFDSGFGVVEFASSRQWRVPMVQTIHPHPLIMTQWQQRDFEGFHNEVAQRSGDRTRAEVKLLASTNYNHVILAHINTPFANDPKYGGISELNIDDLVTAETKLLYTDKQPLMAVLDRAGKTALVGDFNSRKFRTKGSAKEWDVGPLGQRDWPIHMDLEADILVALQDAGSADLDKALEVRSIKENRRKLLIGPPRELGRKAYFWQTALLPNGTVLASFAIEGAQQSSTAPFGLYRLDRGGQRWENLGPFRLMGASNSGNVILVSKAPGNMFLLWPKGGGQLIVNRRGQS